MDFELKFIKNLVIYNFLTGETCVTFKNVPDLLSWCKLVIYNSINKDKQVTNILFKNYINKTSIETITITLSLNNQ